MSLARRSKTPQSVDQLIGKLPGKPRSFDQVHINREGDTEYPLSATYPILTPETKRLTFAAYNLYVKAYNSKARSNNLKIKKYNNTVDFYLQQEKPKNAQRIQAHFLVNHGHLNTWDYNIKVLEYNNTFGNPIIPQKKIQTIKQSTEKVFSTLLWEYGHQLMQMKRHRESSGLCYVREVFKIEVNTKHLENTKGEFDLYMLDYCPDTILNHKKRLMEAGILLNSQYRGSERGTLHHINPQILVVFDDYDQKIVCADNQLLKITQPEVFRDTVLPTRSINKPKVKRDVHNFTSHDKDKAEMALDNALPAEDSTRAPSGKVKNPELANRAAKIGVPENTPENMGGSCSNSEFLEQKIVPLDQFSQELAQNIHEKCKPLPLDRLNFESKTGTLSRSAFRELLIQDLFKQFSQIYLKHPHFKSIFPGVWYNSVKMWMLSNEMMNKNGETLHKDKCLYRYRCILFALTDKSFGALPIIRRTKFIAPAPGIYLNPKNNTPGTFGYHFNEVAKNSVKKLEAESKLIKSQHRSAENSKEYSNNLRKLNRQIGRWFHKKISDQTLFQYVRDNMPKEVQLDFHKHIENFKNNKSL